MPSLKRRTVYARRRLTIRSTLLTVPLVVETAVSRVEISLSRSSSAMSGRTMNISSYVRFMRFSPNLLGRVRRCLVVLFAVKAVHRRCRTFRQNHLHRCGSPVEDFVDDLQLPPGERPQNALLGRDPQADANRPQRQVQLVVNHDQVRLRTQLIFVQQLLYGDAAQVHERIGFGQQDGLVPDLRPAREGAALMVPHFHRVIACDAVDGEKPEVMRRELILDSRIAQSNDQFHALSLAARSSRPQILRSPPVDRGRPSSSLALDRRAYPNAA